MDRRFKSIFYDKKFLQAKYDYYKRINFVAVMICTLLYLSYFFFDLVFLRKINPMDLLARFFVLGPLAFYILIFRKVNNYRIATISSYVMLHLLQIGTYWAIYYASDQILANDGIMPIYLILFVVGFSAPAYYTLVSQIFFLLVVFLSHLFLNYQFFPFIFLIDTTCSIGITCIHYVSQINFIDHYKSMRNLERTNRTDNLTKAYNRNMFSEIDAEANAKFFSSSQKVAGVLMLDIDFFKKVNDCYGHDAGDIILVSVVDTVKNCVRRSDYVIRWGGEEFVIILPDADVETSLQIAENIRNAIEKSVNGICSITVSIGVSVFKGGVMQNAVSEADAALYEAKRTGRNKVVKYTSK